VKKVGRLLDNVAHIIYAILAVPYDPAIGRGRKPRNRRRPPQVIDLRAPRKRRRSWFR
jgi:hypothetical protein